MDEVLAPWACDVYIHTCMPQFSCLHLFTMRGRKHGAVVTLYAKCVLFHTGKSIQGASLRGRPMPAATLDQKGKVHQIMRSGQRSMIEYSFMPGIIIGANWRLGNAKSPAAMLQKKTPWTPHTLRVAAGSARQARSDAVRTCVHTYRR